jgi:hypothetical protein
MALELVLDLSALRFGLGAGQKTAQMLGPQYLRNSQYFPYLLLL